MEKEFLTYELAMEMKRLGYNELCLARWYGGGFYMLPAYDPLRNSEITEPWFCTIPLWQQAIHWCTKQLDSWGVRMWNDGSGSLIHIHNGYEEEFNSSRECLEKLIELCEKKQLK